MAKQEKTNLEVNLAELEDKSKNWETQVISRIQNTFQDTITMLEMDRTRALERINIITARLNTNHQNTCINLEAEINNFAKKITDATKQIQFLTVNINNIKQQLDTLDINQTQLEKINTKITETENAIKLIEKDIASL